MSKLNEAEISIREEGTISADDLETELGGQVIWHHYYNAGNI